MRGGWWLIAVGAIAGGAGWGGGEGGGGAAGGGVGGPRSLAVGGEGGGLGGEPRRRHVLQRGRDVRAGRVHRRDAGRLRRRRRAHARSLPGGLALLPAR